MDQMQTNYLYLLQAMTAPRMEVRQEVRPEKSQESDFRKMMEEHSAGTEEKEPVQQDKPAEEAQARQEQPEQPDEAVLQDLAAMQLFCADTTQVIVTQEAAPTAVQQVAAPEAEAGAGTAEELLTAQQPAEDAELPVEQMPRTEQTASAEQPAAAEGGQPVVSAQETPGARHQSGEGDLQEGDREQTESMSRTERPAVEKTEVQEQPENAQAPVFEKVETAPVKVSETAKPAEAAENAPVETQVSEKLTQALANGETRVELQLSPEHLGKITIELTQKADGSLAVVLHAENSQTRALLERDASGLQSLLSRDVQQEVQVDVPKAQEGQQRENYDGHQQQSQHRQEQRQQHQSTEDFLNPLRLGLIPLEEATL